MAVRNFNLNYYTSQQARYRYKDMQQKVTDLQAKVGELTNLLEDNKDNTASYIHTIKQYKQMITNLERKEHILPPKVKDIKKTILSIDRTCTPPTASQWYDKYMSVPLTSFPIKQGLRYAITADVTKSNMFYLSPISKNMFSVIGNEHFYIFPGTSDNEFVKFTGKQVDNNLSKVMNLRFTGMTNTVMYIFTSNTDAVNNLHVYEYHHPQNDPNFDQISDVPLPEPTHSDPNSKNNPVVAHMLNTILGQLKKHEIDIPKVWYSEDENGNINYRFSANLVQQQMPFLKAVGKLNDHNGMTRVGSLKDCWVELDPAGDLVIKYRGNDHMFNYTPSKNDIMSKDWVVENNRPFNPNTKPNGSDDFDDSADTGKYGFGINGGPYTDQFGTHNEASINGNNTNTDKDDK